MTSDPRELVARLDALAADQYPGMWHAHGTMVECYEAEQIGLLVARTELPQEAEFIAALHSAYPALRAAVLRVAELEDIGRRVLKGIDDWNDAVTSIIDCERRTWPALEELRAALTAPQGEEQSRG